MASFAMRGLTRRAVNLGGFVGCAALMGAAFFFEYVMKLTPCNMCMLQRIAVSALGLAFLVATLHDPRRVGARLYALLILVASGAAIALSAKHIWMQMQPPGSLPSCGADFFTMVDMLPFTTVVTRILAGGGECQAIVWSLFGLSMPAWLLIAVTVLGGAGVVGGFVLPRGRGETA